MAEEAAAAVAVAAPVAERWLNEAYRRRGQLLAQQSGGMTRFSSLCLLKS